MIMIQYQQFDDLEFHRDFENLKSLETLIDIKYYNISSKITMMNKIKNNYHSVEDMDEIYSTEEEKQTFKDKIKLFFQKIGEFLKKMIDKIVHFIKSVYYKWLLFLKKIGFAKGISFHYLSEDEFNIILKAIFHMPNDKIFIPKLKYSIRNYRKEMDTIYNNSANYIRNLHNIIYSITDAMKRDDLKTLLTLFENGIDTLTSKSGEYHDLLVSIEKCKEISQFEPFILSSKTTSKEFYKKFDQVYMNDCVKYMNESEKDMIRFKSVLNEQDTLMRKFADAIKPYESLLDNSTVIGKKFYEFNKIFMDLAKSFKETITIYYNLLINMGKGFNISYKLYEVRN